MHLTFKHHFPDTADVANKPGSHMQMNFKFSSAGITRLGILSWHPPPHMLYMHITMRSKVKFSYFGTLKHHLPDLAQCPNKPGIG
jgi:hypothetical protein